MILALGSVAAHAVVPSPDGGYPGFNTAEGTKALLSLTTGSANTAVGWFSLSGDTTASFNTGVGAGTLVFNNGDSNTAVGAAALLDNTTGGDNTAVGVSALQANTGGSFNTAAGLNALSINTTGVSNTAVGWGALLSNQTGSNNTAIGVRAGQNITGDSNICIGSLVAGVQGENNTIRIGNNLPNGSACYIGGIFQELVVGGDTVICNSVGKLGTGTSSKRFKEAIKPMDEASEVILALSPVTFRYKKELDPTGRSQFGLVAEDVERVNPNLVVHDKDGRPYSVRYDQVNAMLLNEFLKEHKKVEELKREFQATAAKQQKEIQALTAQLKEQAAQIQKVSARFEMNAATIVRNGR